MQRASATETNAQARLLVLVTGLFWLSQYAFTPYINPELERMGMSATFMGLVAGGYGLSQTLIRIPLGLWSDRMGRKKPFVVTGCALVALSAAGYLLFYSPGGFLISRILGGAAAASWVSFTVLFSALFPADEGPRRITQLNAANIAGRLAGYGLMALLLLVWNVRASFVASLAAGALALVLALNIKEERVPKKALGIRDMMKAAGNPYLMATSVLGILAMWVSFGSYNTFTVNVAMRLGAGQQDMSLLQIALLVPNTLSNIVIGRGSTRQTGAHYVVALGFLLAALYCLILPLVVNLAQLYALQVVGGVSATLTFAVLLGQCVRDTAPAQRSVAMGFFQASFGIGMTLGPIVTGMMIDGLGFAMAFVGVAALALLSAVLSILLMKPKGTTSLPQPQ